ncbi:MAG: hypothetical protein ACK6DZ_09485 [Acidobacteriota bacterium]
MGGVEYKPGPAALRGPEDFCALALSAAHVAGDIAWLRFGVVVLNGAARAVVWTMWFSMAMIEACLGVGEEVVEISS